MPIRKIPSIHGSPRPPKLRTPPTRPTGPRMFQLGKEPGVIPDFHEPPLNFPGPNISKAHTSRTEWTAYNALAKVMRTPRDPRKTPFVGGVDWDYQVPDPVEGGREIAGGSIVDFVIRRGNPPFAIRIQTSHWHILASPQVQKRDLDQKTHIKSYSRIIAVYDDQLLGDKDGQKACRAMRKAVALGEQPNPIIFGTAQKLVV